MKKVRILFFIYQMGAGGAARTMLNIINNLDRTKFKPILVTLNYDGSYESMIRDDVKFIKLDTKRLSQSILKLAKIIRSEKVDVVFSTIPRVNTIAIMANLLSFTKAKNVVREADNLGGSFSENLKLLGFGFVYKFSAQIISLSIGVKENLVNRYKIKPTDIEVIYNPIDLQHIQKCMTDGEIDAEFSKLFDDEKKIIITVGRLVEQKDQRTLIKAFANVRKQVASRLILLGEGELKSELMKLSKDLKIEADVHFIGFQHNPYIYFKKADLFTLSSKHEGFSHVIAEALATGTPVVSTDCKSGPREVLMDGKYGALCKVGDVEGLTRNMLEMLSLDNHELNAIRVKGYERAESFNAHDIVQQYEHVFLRVSGSERVEKNVRV